MNGKDIIKLINEEINEFDFLRTDEDSKIQENIDLLKNEDLQKQFICDSLISGDKIKSSVVESTIGGDWEEDEASRLDLTYYLSIEYKYDESKEPLNFSLDFEGQVSVTKSDDYDAGSYANYVAPSGGAWFSDFDWNDISATLTTSDGDVIPFVAFDRAPTRIKALFIRQYVESYILNYTELEIRTPEMKDKIQNVPYC